MSKGEKTRMNVTLSSCFVLPFFRICNPKAIILWILNPHDKASGLQIPKDEGMYVLIGYGFIEFIK